MHLFDTHAHIDNYEFPGDYKSVIQRSLDAGVWLCNIGTTKQTSEEAVRIAAEFPKGVFASVGLHPDLVISGYEKNGTDLAVEPIFDYEFYKNLALKPGVVGIGECGLDYYRKDGLDMREVKRKQREALMAQITLANETDKALIIHCRATKDSFDAYEDLLAIIDEQKPQRFVVHGFTATAALASAFIGRGAYIALNGIITFDKTGLLKEVIQQCPLERIVVETDAPYLAPVPLRGTKNEPRNVAHVAEFLAATRGIDVSDAARVTTENALQLYKIYA